VPEKKNITERGGGDKSCREILWRRKRAINSPEEKQTSTFARNLSREGQTDEQKRKKLEGDPYLKKMKGGLYTGDFERFGKKRTLRPWGKETKPDSQKKEAGQA